MTGTRPWRDCLAAIADLVPEGTTLAPAWAANLSTPAIICTPLRRIAVQPRAATEARWELALQVVVTLAGDEDDQLHDLLDLVLPALPAGVRVGDTAYGQDDRAGGTYIVSTTTLTA